MFLIITILFVTPVLAYINSATIRSAVFGFITGALLLENGDPVILEDGGHLLLE